MRILPERGLSFFLCIDHHTFLPEEFNHFRVFRGIGLVLFSFNVFPGDISSLGLDFKNLVVLNGRDEIGIIFLYNCLSGFTEKIEKKDHNDDDDCPEDEIFIEGIQGLSSNVA